ncbi:MAG TPA: GNAT family N-acetyltransferase [Flavitalea sp.]|nr:GNAT family N-acetyltransferase [Flavitalea sp.]
MIKDMIKDKATTFIIDRVTKADYQELIIVWEASVRATHDFLSETDIAFYRNLILNQYFDLVALKCVKDKSGNILGFLGTTEQKIEMLFVHPDSRGQGIGKTLIRYAVRELGIRLVDVNEQNTQAVGFYYAMGFTLQKRSPLDGMGKPYPILHLNME